MLPCIQGRKCRNCQSDFIVQDLSITAPCWKTHYIQWTTGLVCFLEFFTRKSFWCNRSYLKIIWIVFCHILFDYPASFFIKHWGLKSIRSHSTLWFSQTINLRKAAIDYSLITFFAKNKISRKKKFARRGSIIPQESWKKWILTMNIEERNKN